MEKINQNLVVSQLECNRADALVVVDVMYENVEGWHRFTSPQIPGFCVIVEPDQFQTGLDDIPEAIANIIAGDHGKHVRATRLKAEHGDTRRLGCYNSN